MSPHELAAEFREWATRAAPGAAHPEVWLDFWLETIKHIRKPEILNDVLAILEGKDETTMAGRGRKRAPATTKPELTDEDIFGPADPKPELTDEDIFGPPDKKPELTDEDIFGPGETPDMTQRKRNSKGRPAEARLLRHLKTKSQQGDIIAFLLEKNGQRTIEDVENEFFIKRNNVLSTLNIVAKNTGIGYNVIDEKVTVLLPVGVKTPFAD